MPREFFNNAYSTPDWTGPQVTVGWDRAPEVQIGVIHTEPEVVKALEAALTDLKIENGLRLGILEKLTGPEASALGWHSSLNRSELNRLIRTLRRARDAAFGADA